ncbi:MAG: sigma-70 family RNA polymerase sigma factor [Planctomycetota bacterium]
MNTTSESLLIRLGRETTSVDENAWQEFVELYTPLIFRWSRKIGLSENDASDLVQDVLTLVFQKLAAFRYEPSKSFRGWLRTVTMNRYRESVRRKSAAQQVHSNSILEQLQHVERAESTWDIDYARLLIVNAMDSMKSDFAESTWQALKLVIGEQVAVEEAAEKIGVSPWTIYSAKSRLLRRLREKLTGLL